MTIRNLGKMFAPKSLALVGASTKEGSVGHVLMHNVLESGFSGPIMPVNPKHASVSGIIAYPDIQSLPMTPDLAVLTIAPQLVPKTVAELGARGTRAVVVITAGFNEIGTPEGRALEQEMLKAAQPYNLRIIGPNCLGIMVPGINLNASFAHIAPAKGKLAFISQSGALCTAILDYVAQREIGFSHFVSLGNCSDVDFGDMLDYLASDADTSAILLYIESVSQVRKFMSASRAAARNKPVIVIKSGRNQAGAKAASSHTGALIGSDAVYDVAFKRAGMLRVYDMEELFDSVETLARLQPGQVMAGLAGDSAHNRLLIVSNGGGPAVLATDYLSANGGRLAELSAKTIEQFNAVLPATWSHGNPVDIIGDASDKRYADALAVAMNAPEADAVFVMKCPTAVSENLPAARAVVEVAQRQKNKSIFTCWLGDATAKESRQLFAQAGIATYDMPEKGVRAFLHLAEYRHNQAMLMEVPPTVAQDVPHEATRAQAIIDKAFAEQRGELFENEAKDVLSAYGIPVVKTMTASGAEEAAALADTIGYPVALKILSPDISHKSDVGGVILSLENAVAVRSAAESMLANVKRLKPQARIEGFTVQQMITRGGYELIVGVSTDRQFGPVIMFGEGGVAVEVLDDKALMLPPLNALLAKDMIKRTRVYKRLKGFRDRKPVNLNAIVQTLVQVSQLVTDIADIAELDINPLVADERGLIALDARIKITRSEKRGHERLAISTYPEILEETTTIRDGTRVRLRPVRPQDAPALKDMVGRLTPHDLYQRFQGEPPVSPSQIARLTHIDYDREMVFVAVPENDDQMLACLLCTMHPGSPEAEFTLVVRSDMKGQGLGHALTEKIIAYVESRPGIATLAGYVLPENAPLIALVKELGFAVEEQSGSAMLKVTRRISYRIV